MSSGSSTNVVSQCLNPDHGALKKVSLSGGGLAAEDGVAVGLPFCDAEFTAMQSMRIPSERAIQDYRSAYNDIRD